MIWILLAALGVPLLLVVGALTGALLSQRAFKRRSGVFRAKLRVTAGECQGIKTSWSRLPMYACWVHDVLLVHQGIALVRSRALPVARVTGPIAATSPDTVKKLGPKPIVLPLVLDDNTTVEVAAPADSREIVVGPFFGSLVATLDEERTVANEREV
jgi:hypothetical protein